MINKLNNKQQFWLAGFSIIIFAILIFRTLLTPGNLFFCTDGNIGIFTLVKSLLPWAIIGHWGDYVLAGAGGYMSAGITNFLLFILPVISYTNWIYPLLLAGSSLFLMGFLRRSGLSWSACMLGVLTAFWLSSNFTLAYAGHLGKFGVLFFASLALWTIGTLPFTERKASAMILTGGAMGMMIVEQADVGLFFGLILGPYVLFVLFFKCRVRLWVFIKLLSLLLIMTFLIALRPALEGYQENIKDAATLSDEDPAVQWEFATQWSWPPEESIDFIAPGYTGWRSGEPAGPYWGRMGRSADWENTGRGFPNFKLENVYFGAIPAAMAFFAILTAFITRRRKIGNVPPWEQSTAISEIWFWSIVALLTLLLAFGKYFPLYHIFYRLPLVGSIRNPNKFLQIFQIAIAILAAYGLDAILSLAGQRQAGEKK